MAGFSKFFGQGSYDLRERRGVNLKALQQHQVAVAATRSRTDTPDADADAEQFTIDEKRCCAFWGFAVTRDDGLTLRWDGPPGTEPLIDRLVTYFDGNAPLGSLVGII